MGIAPVPDSVPVSVYAHPDYVYVNIIIIVYVCLFLYILKTFRVFSRYRFTLSRSEEIPLVGS